MTTKELTALASEAFNTSAVVWHHREPGRTKAWAYTVETLPHRHQTVRQLVVRGDTRAEAEARFVACLRAIAAVQGADKLAGNSEPGEHEQAAQDALVAAGVWTASGYAEVLAAARAEGARAERERCANICEAMVVGGRAWTEEQAIVADALFAAAKNIRELPDRAAQRTMPQDNDDPDPPRELLDATNCVSPAEDHDHARCIEEEHDKHAPRHEGEAATCPACLSREPGGRGE